MTSDDLSPEARLAAVELLLREALAFSPARGAIVGRAQQMADAREREAALHSDQGRRQQAAAVRVALARLTE